MIRKVNGKNSSLNVGQLNVCDVVTCKADIADALADTFAEKFSSSNYLTSFQRLKITKEKTKVNFSSNNNEQYKKDFTIKELKRCHDGADGCDDIHCQVLKHFSLLIVYFGYLIKSGILVYFQIPGRDNSYSNTKARLRFYKSC